MLHKIFLSFSSFIKRKTKFKKAVFREYTDDTFSEQKLTPAEQGLVGPVIWTNFDKDRPRLNVHFKNLASRNYSLHVGGGLYMDKSGVDNTAKASEGKKSDFCFHRTCVYFNIFQYHTESEL